jgi:hypothetical protein
MSKETGNGKLYRFKVMNDVDQPGSDGGSGTPCMSLTVRAHSRHEATAKLRAALQSYCETLKMED